MADAQATPKKGGGGKVVLIILGVLALLAIILVVGGIIFWNMVVAPKLPSMDDSGKVTIKTDKGNVTFGGDQLPKDFPKDVAIYPGAKVESSVSGENEGKKGSWVYLSSNEALAKIAAFYEEKMKAAGWSLQTNNISGGAFQQMAFKKGERATLIMLTGETGKTTIAIFNGTE
jgi:hypothetical protein